MLSWRARRQLIIALILAIILGGIGFLFASRFIPEPTCFDNRKNQGELEADCGGPCAPCELRNPAALKIFWARAVEARPGFYDVAALIENVNEALSSREVRYEFILFDDLGSVAFRQGTTYIFPRERTYVIEANLETSRVPTRVEFKMSDVSWEVLKDGTERILVERRDYALGEENGRKRSLVEAALLNRASVGFKEVEVLFVVLDEKENVLGVNKILVEDFLPGMQRTVKSVWPREFEGEVAKIIVEPRVNLFDPTVILKPQ